MDFIIFSTILTVASATTGSELVPERYLRPRDFNPHPFTDTNEGGVAKQLSIPDEHPYAILASKRPREGRDFPQQNAVYYPNPPSAVLPRKPSLQVHLQSGHYENDPYNSIPKNYAFSYSVRDKNSGDDFSHSQAHNGKATRGQYRVKLPDGRVQVVSYTADHKGYRADVQYEGAAAQYQQPTPIYEHSTPAPEPAYVHHQAAPHHYQHSYPPTAAAPYYQQHYEPTYTATPAPYHQEQYSPSPTPYIQEQAYSPTPAPYHQEQSYSPTPGPYEQHQQQHIVSATPPSPYAYSPTPPTYSEYNHASPSPAYQTILSYNPQQVYHQSQTPRPQIYASPSPPPQDNFASPSPITFPTSAPEQQSYQQTPGLQAYASPSESPYEATPEYQNYVSPSNSPFAVQSHLRSSPAPFARHQFVTSTESSILGHILVTPRTQRNANNKNASRRVFGAREHILYRFKSQA